MESAKIRIKVGSMELEYEGDPSFLKDGLIDLLHKMSGFTDALESEGQDEEIVETVATTTPTPKVNGNGVSTTTIAAGLDAKSCSDLALAALSKLQIVDGADGASRQEITAEMKSATGYYKQSMRGGNLTKALTALVKAGRLNQLANERYSLRAAEKQKVEAKVAEIG